MMIELVRLVYNSSVTMVVVGVANKSYTVLGGTAVANKTITNLMWVGFHTVIATVLYVWKGGV